MNPRFLNVPGYAEAAQRQEALRDSVFLGLPLTICGLPCDQLNARHLAILTHCRNGFVCGGEITGVAVGQFLWCLSPDYSPINTKGRAARLKQVSGLNFAKAKKEIEEYTDGVFMDSHAGGSPRSESYNSWLAGLVDALASEYGWKQQEILDLPLAAVFQYVRLIRKRNGDNEPQFNKLTDEVKTKVFTELNPTKN